MTIELVVAADAEAAAALAAARIAERIAAAAGGGFALGVSGGRTPGRMFRLLADHGINIQAISTSEIKISVLIDRADCAKAVKAGR